MEKFLPATNTSRPYSRQSWKAKTVEVSRASARPGQRGVAAVGRRVLARKVTLCRRTGAPSSAVHSPAYALRAVTQNTRKASQLENVIEAANSNSQSARSRDHDMLRRRLVYCRSRSDAIMPSSLLYKHLDCKSRSSTHEEVRGR
jgi:hypothetical protein